MRATGPHPPHHGGLGRAHGRLRRRRDPARPLAARQPPRTPRRRTARRRPALGLAHRMHPVPTSPPSSTPPRAPPRACRPLWIRPSATVRCSARVRSRCRQALAGRCDAPPTALRRPTNAASLAATAPRTSVVVRERKRQPAGWGTARPDQYRPAPGRPHRRCGGGDRRRGRTRPSDGPAVGRRGRGRRGHRSHGRYRSLTGDLPGIRCDGRSGRSRCPVRRPSRPATCHRNCLWPARARDGPRRWSMDVRDRRAVRIVCPAGHRPVVRPWTVMNLNDLLPLYPQLSTALESAGG